MEEFIYYNELYDIYKPLLTIKQQQYFEEYYYNNLSLSEISENYDISRNAISKQINVIRDKLKGYENKLNLHTKKEKIYKALDSTSDHAVAEIIKNII